jgi:chemotaxis protein CheX
MGTGSIACSAAFACKISSQLLMAEYSAVDEEVLDAVAEVTNMVVGNVKTLLEEILGPLGLSIPTVIFGRNFTSRSAGTNEWTVVPFLADGVRFQVQVCLAQNKGNNRPKQIAGSEMVSV